MKALVFGTLTEQVLSAPGRSQPEAQQKQERRDCRPGCGACCIAPSITSAIPGMPQGKPAGVRCVNLDEANRCRIFGRPDRPAFCGGLQASAEMCGDSPQQAMHWLGSLERLTAPSAPSR